jgi:hypothetical protein
MLEWGQSTSQPGSLVRDAKCRPVFTGSRVALRGSKPATIGKVTELISETVVAVSWGRVSERIDASKLVVQR